MAQSQRNMINRWVLLDRVLQLAHRKHSQPILTTLQIKSDVLDLLEISPELLPQGFDDETSEGAEKYFEHLWSSHKAFWNDLREIHRRFPKILLHPSQRRWHYASPYTSLFHRFAPARQDSDIESLIPALEYMKGLQLAEEFDVQPGLNALLEYCGASTTTHLKSSHSFFQFENHQDEGSILTNPFAKDLLSCMQDRGITSIRYRSTREGLERHLEFHPWEFKQSQGRWYVVGYISKDYLGNYPANKRSDYPGLSLKISEIINVERINTRKFDSSMPGRIENYEYQDREKHKTILNFQHRIGIGGWDNQIRTRLNFNPSVNEVEVLLSIKVKSDPYLREGPLGRVLRNSNHEARKNWKGYKFTIRYKKPRINELELINRELLDLLRSRGKDLEIIRPKVLIDALCD